MTPVDTIAALFWFSGAFVLCGMSRYAIHVEGLG